MLICHSSYRGVVDLFRDLFDTSISAGTVHNRLEAAAATATEINQTQDLSGIEVVNGLVRRVQGKKHDSIGAVAIKRPTNHKLSKSAPCRFFTVPGFLTLTLSLSKQGVFTCG